MAVRGIFGGTLFLVICVAGAYSISLRFEIPGIPRDFDFENEIPGNPRDFDLLRVN